VGAIMGAVVCGQLTRQGVTMMTNRRAGLEYAVWMLCAMTATGFGVAGIFMWRLQAVLNEHAVQLEELGVIPCPLPGLPDEVPPVPLPLPVTRSGPVDGAKDCDTESEKPGTAPVGCPATPG
jgi:hypothetical protein